MFGHTDLGRERVVDDGLFPYFRPDGVDDVNAPFSLIGDFNVTYVQKILARTEMDDGLYYSVALVRMMPVRSVIKPIITALAAAIKFCGFIML